ncbi:MAG: YbaB/EbfC family nucleoid-associated protein [Candidatus Dormibacteria bacterium]|jgi:DNA-binding YbaB/EbfC family protein|nr:YbaB/EbfC family nucleoid-associated protein [Chloroflexota bacterium]
MSINRGSRVNNPNMLKQIQQMQARMARMQEELGGMTVTGTAGGGAVTVVANGHQQVQSVVIDAEVLEEGAELLADLVLAAVNSALDQSRELATKQMGQLTAGLNLPPGLL